ncbi:NAD(P)-binding protein [Xylariaceae sp. FL0016]|nr:NAD(P)-binding protein [Xylariaceae sp. FL0016]
MTEQWLEAKVSAGIYPPVPPDFGAKFTATTRYDTYEYIDPLRAVSCRKVVLITGGNKGIGKAIALSYARRGASHIAITSRSEATDAITEVRDAALKAKRDLPDVLNLTMDVTDKSSVAGVAAELARRWGRLDILINNAGYLSKYEKILDGDVDEWWQSFETNLRGGYLVSKAFLPLMLKGGDKTIISISSTGAMHFHAGGSGYQISKFALLRLMEFLMAEYADQGLLTYSVHPGGVATDLARRLPDETQAWLKCSPSLGGDTIAFLTLARREWLAGRYVTAMWDMEEFLEKKGEIIEKDLLKMRMSF